MTVQKVLVIVIVDGEVYLHDVNLDSSSVSRMKEEFESTGENPATCFTGLAITGANQSYEEEGE